MSYVQIQRQKKLLYQLKLTCVVPQFLDSHKFSQANSEYIHFLIVKVEIIALTSQGVVKTKLASSQENSL